MTNININAIIVTYNISQDFLENLKSVIPQVNQAIIVDNGGSEEVLANIPEAEQKKVQIIKNDSNIGLAAAQNLGINQAVKNKADWVLFLDDDSRLEENMIKNMLAAYEENPAREKIAIITPRIRDENSDLYYPALTFFLKFFFLRRKTEGKAYINGLFSALASGSLIKREVLEELGKMREDLFIDFIDWEFALRALSKGWKIMAAGNALMHHTIGKKTTHTLLGKKFVTTNHTPERRYWAAKNRVIFWKLYAAKYPAVFLYTAMAFTYEMILIALFEEERPEKLGKIIQGMKDGIFAKKLPE